MLIYAWWDHHDWVSRNAVSWRGPRLILWWWYLDYLITWVRGLWIEFPLPTSLVIKLVTSIKIWWVHHLLTCLHVRGVIWVPTIYVGGLGPNTQSPTLLVLWLHIMTESNAASVALDYAQAGRYRGSIHFPAWFKYRHWYYVLNLERGGTFY